MLANKGYWETYIFQTITSKNSGKRTDMQPLTNAEYRFYITTKISAPAQFSFMQEPFLFRIGLGYGSHSFPINVRLFPPLIFL